MTDLPAGWELAELQDLAAAEPRSMTDGPFGSNLKSAHYAEDGPRVIRLQNIGFGDFIDERAHISAEHFETLRVHEVRAGDLVVASLGQDLPRSCLIPEYVGPAIVKADCIRVRLHPEVDPGYVNYALQRPALRTSLADQIHGVGRPRLGMAGIRMLAVPVPPRSEQERIVAAIEEHLSRLDAADSGLRRASQRIRSLSWGPAESVWAEGAAEQSLESLGRITTGSTPSTKEPALWGEELPFVTPGDLDPGGFVSGAKRGLSATGRRVARVVPPTSVLVTCIGATLGKASMLTVPAAFNQQINAVEPDDSKCNPRYLLMVLASPTGQRRLWSTSSSTTLPILNKRRFSGVEVPLPPLEKQVDAVARAEALSVALEDLKAELALGRVRAAALRRSILAAAFAGKLVPQDPDDEPASVLLDRTRAERAVAKPKRRTRAARHADR